MSGPNAVWPDGTRWAVGQAHDQWMKRSQFDPTSVATDILTALEPFVQQRIEAEVGTLVAELREYQQVIRDHDNTATPAVLRGLLDQFKSCREERDRLRAEVATLRAERADLEADIARRARAPRWSTEHDSRSGSAGGTDA